VPDGVEPGDDVEPDGAEPAGAELDPDDAGPEDEGLDCRAAEAAAASATKKIKNESRALETFMGRLPRQDS
jgi:hypothetical protein